MSESDEKAVDDLAETDVLGASWLRFRLWRRSRFDTHPEDDDLDMAELIGVYAREP